jgi:hypothetical protein
LAKLVGKLQVLEASPGFINGDGFW